VVNITSDRAANVRAAVCNELQVPWLYCIAHALNRTIRLALDDPGFKPLMKKAKKLVKTFKCSPLAAQLLLCSFRIKSLKLDNETRWSSACEMVKWLLAVHPAISATLAALPNLRRTPPCELSHEEWGLLSSLLLLILVVTHRCLFRFC